jgi:hypothetical protein
MKKDNIKQVFQSGIFVVIMLALLFFSEWITFTYFWGSNKPDFLEEVCICCIVLEWIILLFIVVVGYLLGVYQMSMQIVRRFLDNALGLKWLSLVFILGFMVHIAWISEISYSLVVKNETCLGELIVPIGGLLLLCAIFPVKAKNRDNNDKSKRTLLISGITTFIGERSLDLLFKPFTDYPNIRNMVIILSDGLYKSEVQKETEFKRTLKLLSFDDGSSYNDYMNYIEDGNHNKIKELLRQILETYLKQKYPRYANENVNIIFTSEFYDYNDFDSCYKAIGKVLQKYEKGKQDATSATLIHISPGTATISGAMAIYAIKGGRSLVYTRQDTSTIASFDVNIWNTGELLHELWKELDA